MPLSRGRVARRFGDRCNWRIMMDNPCPDMHARFVSRRDIGVVAWRRYAADHARRRAAAGRPSA
ncbi:MAG: hypothetical protein J2P48_06480 [Alphaproteobacteria bacterium]|nr:hypothetical protein [Alphaproteobacteria bacterium]